MAWLELRVPPLLVLLLLGIAMALVAGDVTPAVSPLVLAIALMLVGLGVVLALAGVRAFHSAATTVDPRYPQNSSSLVADGIYRFTRNPMYLGMLCWLGAWGVYLQWPVLLISLVVFVLYMNRFQITPEERAMRAQFGEDYAAYCTRVRRWL